MKFNTSGSACKWIDLYQFSDPHDIIPKLKNDGYQVYSLVLDENAKTIYDIDWNQPKLFLVFVLFLDVFLIFFLSFAENNFPAKSKRIMNQITPKIATGTLKNTENELVFTSEQEIDSESSQSDPSVGIA